MVKTEKRPAFMLLEVLLAVLVIIILAGIADFGLSNLYSAQYSERKTQCDVIDRALEGYASNHLAVRDVTKDDDDDDNEKVIYMRTYPENLEELEKTGYLNHFKDIDDDDFIYTPHKETTYGNVENYTYYELKVKIPDSSGYYTSPGSERSKYMYENE